MNTLGSCETFRIMDKKFSGSITKTIVSIGENVDKYKIDLELFDHLVKSMKVYKQALAPFVIKAVYSGKIQPLLLHEPKDTKDKEIFLTPAIAAFGDKSGKRSFVDLGPNARYIRDKVGNITALKVLEIKLYNYLQYALIDSVLKEHNAKLSSSKKFVESVSSSYARLLSRCIDRTFSISADPMRFHVSMFMTSVFCVKTFFQKTTEEAMDIVFASKIVTRADMTAECRVYSTGKLEFETLEEFLKLYQTEFKEYIGKGKLDTAMITRMFIKMYGPNSMFAVEHCASFIFMITSVDVGLYNNKFIAKTIEKPLKVIFEVLKTTLSNY